MRNQKDRPEAKKCFKDVKIAWDKLVKEYDLPLVKWAVTRQLNWEREKTKLSKEKMILEKRLSEISSELD